MSIVNVNQTICLKLLYVQKQYSSSLLKNRHIYLTTYKSILFPGTLEDSRSLLKIFSVLKNVTFWAARVMLSYCTNLTIKQLFLKEVLDGFSKEYSLDWQHQTLPAALSKKLLKSISLWRVWMNVLLSEPLLS